MPAQASSRLRKRFLSLPKRITVPSDKPPIPPPQNSTTMLTPAEIDELRRNATEVGAYALKAFGRLKKPFMPPAGPSNPMLTPSEIQELRRKSDETIAYARKAFGLSKGGEPDARHETSNSAEDLSAMQPASARLLSSRGRWRLLEKQNGVE